ncbi:zinc finger protein 431-like [Octopus sinensis]|uniref:Zinc finger protein 431-like n=1 Tax=Octopus sinensis TaxID=2607531 RepID=A0A7E6FS54_9MOLL|nr:zinc finger protein 431-like [Octopus sinensis]
MLTTFNTPFGRYRFNRLPFRLKVSQDVFQRQIDETYQGCKGAIGIADDIQVNGKDETTHDFSLHEAMEKTRQAGIKLNADKCVIKEKECKFFGIIYSAEGVKPDPAKVEAIRDIKEPKDKKELKSFLGLIHYMGAFIPKLADHTANLRELNKDDVEFDWCASHTQDFKGIKKLISKEATLQYYDRRKPVTLQVDASMRGVGAALIQEGEQPYPCDICGKSFSRSDSLTKHKRIHTGEKPYHCDICGKSFSRYHSLAIHIRTHTVDKPYDCDICGKSFYQSGNLTNHKRVHTGEESYCDICGKSLSSGSSLSKHKRIHMGRNHITVMSVVSHSLKAAA